MFTYFYVMSYLLAPSTDRLDGTSLHSINILHLVHNLLLSVEFCPELLIFKLLHYQKQIPTSTAMEDRDRQLWSPLLRIFQNSLKAFDFLQHVVKKYIQKHLEQKSHTDCIFSRNNSRHDERS